MSLGVLIGGFCYCQAEPVEHFSFAVLLLCSRPKNRYESDLELVIYLRNKGNKLSIYVPE